MQDVIYPEEPKWVQGGEGGDSKSGIESLCPRSLANDTEKKKSAILHSPGKKSTKTREAEKEKPKGMWPCVISPRRKDVESGMRISLT